MCNFFGKVYKEENQARSTSELGLLIAGQPICRRSPSGGVKVQNKTFPLGRRLKTEDKRGCRSPVQSTSINSSSFIHVSTEVILNRAFSPLSRLLLVYPLKYPPSVLSFTVFSQRSSLQKNTKVSTLATRQRREVW